MFHLHTEKQLKYFNEVIRLHYEEGYGEDRISKLLPVGSFDLVGNFASGGSIDRRTAFSAFRVFIMPRSLAFSAASSS